MPCIGRLTYRSFMSSVIIFICSSKCIVLVLLPLLRVFCGVGVRRFIRLFNFLLRYLAVLYAGACVLFTTGLMGSFSLCVFMYTLSVGATGFMFIRYFCVCLSISILHF